MSPSPLQRPLSRLRVELREGAANARTVSPARALDVWRHGFYGRHARIYDFDRFGFDAFVSDFQRATRLGGLNRDRYLIDDKLVSFLLLRSIAAASPTVYAAADDGHVTFLDTSSHTRLGDLLEDRGRLVIKPRGGSGGARFCLVERDERGLRVNGAPASDLQDCLRGRVVISDVAEQHPYAAEVFPDATNTLRVLCLRDPQDGTPFVASAIHRFGTVRSAPVDNTGKGGLPAAVDIAAGVLGPLAAMPGYYAPLGGGVDWLESHPDTGAPVTGRTVAHWDAVVELVLRVMRALPGSVMVGWDVVVTGDGPSIIEGNNRPDLYQLQVHEPLLNDDRVRRFFTHHGVVRRSERLADR